MAKIRESLFQRFEEKIHGCRFLDLFAGSGIMGLEALSRYADFLLAVDQNRKQIQALHEAFESLDLGPEHAKAIVMDALTFIQRPNREAPFDVIFIDPPYGKVNFEKLIQNIDRGGWLAADGLLMIEHEIHEGDRWPTLKQFTPYAFGDTIISVRQA